MREIVLCIIGVIFAVFSISQMNSKKLETINAKAMTFFEYVNAGTPDSWIWIHGSKNGSPVKKLFIKYILVGGGATDADLLPVLIDEKHYVCFVKTYADWRIGYDKRFYSEYINYMRYPDGEFHTSVDMNRKDKSVEYEKRYKKSDLIYKAYKEDVEGGEVVEEVKSGENPQFYFKYKCYLLSFIVENEWLSNKPRKDRSEAILEKDVARKLRIMYVSRKSIENVKLDEEKYAPDYLRWMNEKTKDDPIFKEVEEIK